MPDFNILNYLSKEFNSIYILDISEEKLIPYVSNNQVSTSMLARVSAGQNYNQLIRDYADKYVLGVEHSGYMEAASIPRIRKELSKSDRYNYTFFRYDEQKKIELVEMSVIKMDDDLKQVVITFKTVKESSINLEYERNEVQRQNASLLQNRDEALQAVSNLFYTVYAIDVTKDSFVKVRAIPQISEYLDKQILASYALIGLPEATMKAQYIDSMKEILDMSNWKELFEACDSVTREYESKYTGWCRMNIVVSKRNAKGQVTDVLICVQDIEAEKKKELKHQAELANANARVIESYGVLERLTQEYNAVWIVNAKDFSMELIKPVPGTWEKEENNAIVLAINKPNYNEIYEEYIDRFVVKGDRRKVQREAHPDRILDKLRTKSLHSVNYKRIKSSGECVYHQMVFSKIDTESDDIKFLMAFRDVDEIMKRELENVSREERLAQFEKDQQDIVLINETLGSAGWRVEFGKTGKIVTCSWTDEFRRKIGYASEEEFPNRFESWSELLYEEDKDKTLEAFWNAANDKTGETVFDSEFRLCTKCNELRWFHAAGRFTRRKDGSPVYFIGIFADIDAKKRSEQNLSEQLTIVNALCQDYLNVFRVNSQTQVTKVLKLDGYNTSIINRAEHVTYPYYDLMESYMEERVLPEDGKHFMEAMKLEKVLAELEDKPEYNAGYRVLDKGEIHHFQFVFMKLKEDEIYLDDADKGDIIVAFRNVDAVVKATRERENLRILSETDGMTQIANRSCGERLSRDALSTNAKGMFCIMDVDNFKSINDNFGHDIGDKVLIEVAASLKKTFREKDIVFRLGGDEFAIMAINIPSEEVGRKVVKRAFDYIDKIDIPELGDRKITVSMGAVVFKENSNYTFESIYKEADVHVYISKKSVGSAVTF